LALRFANVGREIEENLSNKYFEDVFLIDSIDILCNEVSCPLLQREKPIYLDWGHTSPYGSLLFANTIKKVLSRAITSG
jgi:hypothetical protein